MLVDFYYSYPDGELEYDNEFGTVDIDYFNIRQWRKLLTKLASRDEPYKFNSVVLKIRPKKETVFI